MIVTTFNVIDPSFKIKDFKLSYTVGRNVN